MQLYSCGPTRNLQYNCHKGKKVNNNGKKRVQIIKKLNMQIHYPFWKLISLAYNVTGSPTSKQRRIIGCTCSFLDFCPNRADIRSQQLQPWSQPLTHQNFCRRVTSCSLGVARYWPKELGSFFMTFMASLNVRKARSASPLDAVW